MKRIVLKALTAASVVALGMGFAQAQSTSPATATMDVDITITTGCTVNFPNNQGNISFGTYARISTQLVETREVTVDCNGGQAANNGEYSLALNEGLNSAQSGSFAEGRKLKSGSDLIAYDVRQASSMSSRSCNGERWDATHPFTGTIDTVSGAMNGSKSHYFVVCIPAPKDQPAVGTYSDSLVATLTY